MKAILISVQPKHSCNILNLIKFLEIRKKAAKCDLPIDVLIYVTNSTKDFLCEVDDYKELHEKGLAPLRYYVTPKKESKYHKCLNGKVVAKFTLNKVERLYEYQVDGYGSDYEIASDTLKQDELLKKCCLTYEELSNYLGDINNGYAWHIDNLVIFDEPKELKEFSRYHDKKDEYSACWTCKRFGTGCMSCKLTKAPQSWCYVEI